MEKQITNYKNIKKLGLCIIAFEGCEHLYNIISELRNSVDYVSIGLQKVSYHGDPISNIDLQEVIRLKEEDQIVDNIVYINLDLNSAPRVQETQKRNILIQDAQDHGCTHCICIDSDEYYTHKSFDAACKKIDENDYPITYCQYINYYHDYNHFLVYPFKNGMHVPFVTRVEYRHDFECTDFTLPSDPTRRFVRPYDSIQKVRDKSGKVYDVKHYTVDYYVFPWNEIKMHHLSWLRANIRKKLNMWSSKTCFDNFNDLIDKACVAFNNFDESSESNKAIMLFNTPGNEVDVKAFPKQYIHPKVDFNTRLRKVPNYKRIIILSMSADMPIFNKLETTCNETWRNIDKNKFKNCDNIEFWTYTDTEEETHVDVENHIIYVKKEPLLDIMDGNYVYRTFSKTITALRELNKLDIKYDYIVRTNNSTWINVPLLNLFLSYQEDDSLIFGASIYSCYWSAFNLYIRGNLLICAKRTVDILTNASVNPVELENKVCGADDNLMFGILNNRLIKLNLKQSDYYHSIGMQCITDLELPDNITFEYPIIQVKTTGDDECRLKHDSEKMYAVHKRFIESDITDENLHTLYEAMMEHYDKTICLVPISKQEFKTLENLDVDNYKQTDRQEAIQQIPDVQKKFGYKQYLI